MNKKKKDQNSLINELRPLITQHIKLFQNVLQNPQSIIIIYFLNFMVGYHFIDKICNQKYKLIFLFYSALEYQTLQAFSIFIAVLIFIYAFSADWLDIFAKEQTDLCKSHRKVIIYTILCSTLYFILLIYYRQFVSSNNKNTKLAIDLTDLFLLGILVFGLCYTIGTLVGGYSPVRFFGLGLTFAPILIILGEITGFSIVPIVQFFK